MYRNLRLRVAAALVAMVCLVFAQVAAAAYACPASSDPAIAQPATNGMDHGDDAGDPCAGHDAERSGLCLAHCSPTDLSLNHAQVDAPPVILVALHPVSDPVAPDALATLAPQHDLPLRGHSPPLAVLHCCFRI